SPKTWQEARLGSNPCQGKIAYVYRVDTGTANAFKALLEGKGFTVQLVPMPTVLATDFTQFDLVIIADDTGDLSQWPMGTAGVSPEANHIRSANKPMLGIGEGGYAYFGKHGQAIGWPNGWHGPLDRVVPRNTGQSYWHTPTDFGSPPPSPQQLFTGPVNEVGIYLKAVTGVIELGTEPSDADHAPLIAEREECSQLWGFSGRPPAMTVAGRNLFVNAVVYGLASQCPQRPTPPDDCVVLEKSADPPAGTLVSVGAVITYKLKYTVKNDPACALARAVLEDKIPDRTLFVPGSATDGIVPGADRVLRWNVGPLAPGASGLKQFKVSVADSICNGQRTVVNQARLVTSLGVFASNVVTHPVDCPPVVPAGNEPPYAEDEIQIYPYPLITGRPTDVSVRIRNLSSMTETVRVTFESSPNNFGIGIPFGTLPAAGNPRVVTLPPFGIVEVKINWTPVKSGHYCIRVKIESPGRPAIFTYRNLDVMEDLRPGVTDTLTFSVGNPTAAVATVNLVVDNTCPGWVASVSPAQLLNMAPGEVRSATLSVIPPTDRPLGTACHIDVQGWIGDVLIGGIRKLDVPPVHLPPANPPWMEREIILIPDPPVLNQPGQLCIELQNPMPTPRVVNVEFRVAAFGAGIGFTPVGSLNNLTLPPNSIGQYCINWTPTPVSGGSLHRCIQVRLSQAGFRDQFSQRNVDVRRLSVGSLNELLKLNIPFTIGNPNDYTVPMDINKILIGLTPRVRPRITPDPPPELMAGQTIDFMLGFEMVPGAEVAAAGALAEDDFALGYGDTARVEVALVLDGEEVGGFSVELENHRLYLPAVRKP
ncbi:MAG: hypothetical protein H3C34_19595, partial [Caldilineaceae bacterium]|nr:hypothetical protein [Caldilineaceae bacterium]